MYINQLVIFSPLQNVHSKHNTWVHGFVYFSVSTPWISGSEEYCFELYYHMYGENIGSLVVYSQQQTGSEAIVAEDPRLIGDQGRQWNLLQINITSNYPIKVTN